VKSGDHQKIMSTQGQTFMLKDTSATKVVTIDSKNIKKISTHSQQSSQPVVPGQPVVQGQKESQGHSQTGQGHQDSDNSLKQCEQEGNCDTDVTNPVEVVGETVYAAESNSETISTKEVPQKITISVNTKDALYNKDEALKISVETPEKPSHQTSFQGKKDKLAEMLSMITSFTEDYLENSGVKSVKSLHEKLKYYSLFHYERPEMLTCKAQPFYMRFSLMGEMFLNDYL